MSFELIRVQVRIDDPELASIVITVGWAHHILDCGTVPSDVISECLRIEREERKKQGEKRG